MRIARTPASISVFGDLLGVFRRNGDHGDLDVVFGDDLRNVSDRMNDETANALVDFLRRAVEDKGDMKAAFGEALITRDRAAKIARADQRDLPFTLDLKHLTKLILQESDFVARSLLAETAKVR